MLALWKDTCFRINMTQHTHVIFHVVSILADLDVLHTVIHIVCKYIYVHISISYS